MTTANWTERTVYTNGQRIHMRIAGEAGPLVLLCHGFPESWYSWRHQLTALSEAGFRAVALDMPGYGRSSKPLDPAAYGTVALVETCAGVVTSLGETSAVIVGHDLGAPVAWTAAWTRPETFRAVVGMSVPFGAAGLGCLPGSPFGERRPSEVAGELAGPDRMFYHEYFALQSEAAAAEAEPDMRGWLTSAFYSLSADKPLPPELAAFDLTKLPDPVLREVVRAAISLPRTPGATMSGLLELPETLPSWLRPEDLDRCVAEMEFTGLAHALKYYVNGDRDWEALSRFQGRPLSVPALYIGGDRDIVTIWSQEAIARAEEHVPDLRGKLILPDCGHWIPQEKPAAVNEALLSFLRSL